MASVRSPAARACREGGHATGKVPYDLAKAILVAYDKAYDLGYVTHKGRMDISIKSNVITIKPKPAQPATVVWSGGDGGDAAKANSPEPADLPAARTSEPAYSTQDMIDTQPWSDEPIVIEDPPETILYPVSGGVEDSWGC